MIASYLLGVGSLQACEIEQISCCEETLQIKAIAKKTKNIYH